MSFLDVYKRGQGKYTRIGTFAGVMLVGMLGAYELSRGLVGSHMAIRFGLPSVVFLGLALLMFWMVNRAKSADFLIATEGEMKKVSWSSRKEVVGSTKVVIVATLMMAVALYAVDAIFVVLFRAIGVMGV